MKSRLLAILSFATIIAYACQSRDTAFNSRVLSMRQSATKKMDFWLEGHRRGANFFNDIELRERFDAAKSTGIQVVRLAPNKWLNGRPKSEVGNFLLGDPGRYQGVVAEDLRYLKLRLDDAHEAGIKVVLTMLSLPGHRWSQHNRGLQERRLFLEMGQQDEALQFWKEVASALKDHPAVVGYNIINEPSPELLSPKLIDWYTGDYKAWFDKVRGTAADLNSFYRRMVTAIREVDAETPIVLDVGFYATPWAFKVMEPVSDEKVIYAFHMYEPYGFTSHENKGRYRYPGTMPIGEGSQVLQLNWDKDQLSKLLAPVREWQARFNIPSSRIFASEFGAYRYNVGIESYLRDLIQLFNEEKWHWAFYSFREDDWEGMDYELGSGKPPAKYWEYIKQGRMPASDVYKGSSIFNVIQNGLR
jgi:endoglucanase